jgi:hypothetical protein
LRLVLNRKSDDKLTDRMVNSLDNTTWPWQPYRKNETVERLIQINEMKEITLKNLMAQLTAEKETTVKLLDIIAKAGFKATGSNQTGGSSSSSGTTTKYDPNRYCRSHGYKVSKHHNSATCKTRKPGHQEGATHNNIMGGCKDNKNWR